MYLDAWKYVKSLVAHHKVQGESSLVFSAVEELVQNWSSHEFEKFVDNLADLVNR